MQTVNIDISDHFNRKCPSVDLEVRVSKLIMLLLAIAAGGLTAVQGAFNANLGKLLSHPLQATLISFMVGTFGTLAAIALLRVGVPPLARLSGIPPYLFLGGLFGSYNFV